jgi:hypothetical protein
VVPQRVDGGTVRWPAAAVLAFALVGCREPSATPDTATGSGAIPAEMERVAADAQRMAPALESHLRGGEYATTLDEAIAALDAAGLEPTPPNVVGGYRYHAEAVEFVLCIESPEGAHASYDTRPMSLLSTGASGGCPEGDGS